MGAVRFSANDSANESINQALIHRLLKSVLVSFFTLLNTAPAAEAQTGLVRPEVRLPGSQSFRNPPTKGDVQQVCSQLISTQTLRTHSLFLLLTQN